MENIKYTCYYCRKEFKNPIVVTNFAIVPRKEKYFACPYCLTKIVNKEINSKPFTIEDTVEAEYGEREKSADEEGMKPEKSTITLEGLDDSSAHYLVTMKELKKLEKDKADLLAELQELRKEATKKISILQKEVDALKKEAEEIKKLL